MPCLSDTRQSGPEAARHFGWLRRALVHAAMLLPLSMMSPAIADPANGPAAQAGIDETDLLLDALIRPYLSSPDSGGLPRGQALHIQPIDLTADADDVWHRIRRGFAIRNISSPQVPQRMSTLLADPQRLYAQLERAAPYLYYIVSECEQRGLPTELALLPFVESSFNPHATSPAGAAGLWQFIPSTGKVFKLKQGGGRDERRDIIASTQAALDYLAQLYDMYGDWYLALAAYNWGEGSVRRAIEANRRGNLGEDYLSLRMPDETRNYVPKLQAIKNIIDSPGAFNFTLPHVENKPFFVSISRSKNLDVSTAARLANLPVDTFRDLNPAFRSHIPADPERSLLVPAEKAGQFELALRKLGDAPAGKVGLKAAPIGNASGNSVGLRANPGQAGGFATRAPAETGNDGLQDSMANFFRPYLFGASPAKAAPAAVAPPAATAPAPARSGTNAGPVAPARPAAPVKPCTPSAGVSASQCGAKRQ